MQKPSNAIAETIVKLQQENENAQASIDFFQGLIQKNLESLTALEPLATWEEDPQTNTEPPIEITPTDSSTQTP